LLEPDAVKVARPVLRRARRREAPGLSDQSDRERGGKAKANVTFSASRGYQGGETSRSGERRAYHGTRLPPAVIAR